ncbi:MAG TPA: Xaa-Pro peptidase family protein [Dehalococcoidia bacterium]|nr:Xaa-Pro peptidase family protein [Dehalococcoidia bacterium]
MSKETRIARLREKLDEQGLAGLFVSAPAEDIHHTIGANRRYLSGFSGSMGHLLITRDAAFIAVDFRYYEQAERESPEYTLWQANGGMKTWLSKLFGEAGLAGQKLGFESSGVTYGMFASMRDIVAELPDTDRPQLVPTDGIVEGLRAIKEPDELEALQRAVDLGDAAFQHVAAHIQPGWTEKQVAWEIEKYAREHGAEGLSFPTIVAAGPWGAMPHAQPRDHVIKDGDGVVIDMGVNLDGYMSDLTRTVVVGKADDEFKKIYDIVLAAQLTAEELVRTGMTGGDAHNIAAKVIEEAGYGDKFGHGLGHGVGLQVHESPRVGGTSADVLQDGMVITVEPGIYLPGWGGIRIEDMGYLKDGKYVNFTKAPKLQFA